MEVLIESVIVLVLVVAFFAVTASFVSAGRQEDIKLRSLLSNMSAMELIKQACGDGGAIEDIADMVWTNDGYVTSVNSINSVGSGTGEIYRIAITTRYNGKSIDGTELVSYVTPAH